MTCCCCDTTTAGASLIPMGILAALIYYYAPAIFLTFVVLVSIGYASMAISFLLVLWMRSRLRYVWVFPASARYDTVTYSTEILGEAHGRMGTYVEAGPQRSITSPEASAPKAIEGVPVNRPVIEAPRSEPVRIHNRV